jgi:hypothetical protein
MLQLPESSLLKLDDICRKADIVLVAARSYGLTGLVRVSVKVLFSLEHAGELRVIILRGKKVPSGPRKQSAREGSRREEGDKKKKEKNKNKRN